MIHDDNDDNVDDADSCHSFDVYLNVTRIWLTFQRVRLWRPKVPSLRPSTPIQATVDIAFLLMSLQQVYQKLQLHA